MVKVKLIHDVYLSHRNGVTTVINGLLSRKDIFESYNIELTTLVPDTFHTRSFEPSQITYKDRLKQNVKSLLTKAAQYSSVAATAMMYIKEIIPGRLMALSYLNNSPQKNEVVFMHSFFLCYNYLKLRREKQKVVLVLHNNGDTFKMWCTYFRALERSFFFKKMLSMENYVLKNIDRLVFVSESSKRNFMRLHPHFDPNKVFCIYNGIKNDSIYSHEYKLNKLEIVCVASITIRKGQKYIIDALKEYIKEKKPNFHITLIGEGNIRMQLEKEVLLNGLSEYISFTGVVNDVDSYLKKSDIFMLPSEDEGLPMSIIEAMRASLPVVSTRVGGIPEMLEDGKNGLFIDPSKEGVLHFFNVINEVNWKQLGNNARINFENKFLLDRMIENYCRVLKFD